MRNITFILLILISIFIDQKLYAQKDLNKAKNHYDNFEYELAIPLYLNGLNEGSKLETIEQLADCYRLTNQYKEACKFYERALDIPYYSATSIFYYAEMLFRLGKYDEAEYQYTFYKNYQPNNIQYVDTCIKSCLNASKLIQQPLSVKIENLKELNSKFSDIGISISGNQIYFSSNRKLGNANLIDSWTGNSYFKIFSIAYKKQNQKLTFQRAKSFDVNINNGYHSFFPTFNQEENKMFYTYTELESNPKKKYQIKAKEFVNRMQIKEAKLVGKRWQRVDSNIQNNINYSMIHPCLNKLGNRLYFSSDMRGGYGSYDLYYSDIDENGKLSKPINLGSKINTTGLEVYPSLLNDSVLYFSSSGRSGLGGLDIYEAVIFDNNFSKVKNIGYPINSSFDDFSYIFSEKLQLSFFSSDRQGGKGKDDIYLVEWQESTNIKP